MKNRPQIEADDIKSYELIQVKYRDGLPVDSY